MDKGFCDGWTKVFVVDGQRFLWWMDKFFVTDGKDGQSFSDGCTDEAFCDGWTKLFVINR